MIDLSPLYPQLSHLSYLFFTKVVQLYCYFVTFEIFINQQLRYQIRLMLCLYQSSYFYLISYSCFQDPMQQHILGQTESRDLIQFQNFSIFFDQRLARSPKFHLCAVETMIQSLSFSLLLQINCQTIQFLQQLSIKFQLLLYFRSCSNMQLALTFWLLLGVVSIIQINAKTRSQKEATQLKQTLVTFYVEQQKRQNEAISFNLQVRESDPSLIEAIQKSQHMQKLLTDIFFQFCRENSEENCDQKVESSKYDIKVEYFRLRGSQIFKAFVIKFQIKFTISSFQLIGVLMEQFSDLMSSHNIIIGDISWEDNDEEFSEEDILDQGMERAKGACQKLGMQMVKIKSVDVWMPKQEEEKPKAKPKKEEDQQQEEQEQEQEEQEQQENSDKGVKYRFIVKCRQLQPAEKPKKSNPTKQQKKKEKNDDL